VRSDWPWSPCSSCFSSFCGDVGAVN